MNKSIKAERGQKLLCHNYKKNEGRKENFFVFGYPTKFRNLFFMYTGVLNKLFFFKNTGVGVIWPFECVREPGRHTLLFLHTQLIRYTPYLNLFFDF